MPIVTKTKVLLSWNSFWYPLWYRSSRTNRSEFQILKFEVTLHIWNSGLCA